MAFLRTLIAACAVQVVLAIVPLEFIQKNDSAARPAAAIPIRQTTYPTILNHKENSQNVLDSISTSRMYYNMQTLTSFHNRYYQSASGVDASDWVFEQLKRYDGTFKIQKWRHENWPQRSIDVQISQGFARQRKDIRHVIVGAHLDSINVENGRARANETRAPGADDNASSVAVLMEALYLLLRDPRTKHFRNKVHFHFYSAEEVGLQGSKEIFEQYRLAGIDVVAFLNQDMSGFKPIDPSSDRFTMVVDHVYGPLNEFLARVIRRYTNLGFKKFKCGYGCSDHASGTKNGFPSAFISHSRLDNSVAHIHTSNDTLENIDYEHMAEHVRLVMGFVYELGFAEFGEPDAEAEAKRENDPWEQADDPSAQGLVSNVF